MADEQDDDVLELTEEAEAETVEQFDPQSEEDEGEEEHVVTFDGEAAPASGERDSGLVKHLRAQIRERDERLKLLQSQPKKEELGPRPKLADFDYDDEKHDEALNKWLEQKAEAERTEQSAREAECRLQEEWANDLKGYAAKKSELRFPDVQESEDVATAVLSQVQQSVIVKAAENPALVIYSLGKHPAKLEALSQINDPLKLAAAVARLEGGLKVTTTRKPPRPEQTVRGSASVAAGTDKELERLEREAERNGGDRSKIAAYKRQLAGRA